jgi:hypothetical protein
MNLFAMKTKLPILFLFIVITSFKPQVIVEKDRIVPLAEFQAMLDSTGLIFTMPEGYKETIVKENGDLYYAFAIKNTKADYEVRYSVWSLKPTIEEYKKCKLDSAHCFMLNPNTLCYGRAQSNVLNMTAGESMDVDPFPTAAVKKEFNADYGGSAFFQFKCEFGKGYKYGQMIVLHKDDVADILITYLSNNKETHMELMKIPFHALIFK